MEKEYSEFWVEVGMERHAGPGWLDHGARRGGGDVLRHLAAFEPLVNFESEELPQPSELVGGHFLAGDPFVHRVEFDAQMLRNLIN